MNWCFRNSIEFAFSKRINNGYCCFLKDKGGVFIEIKERF
jgi:hypothetical protein